MTKIINKISKCLRLGNTDAGKLKVLNGIYINSYLKQLKKA